MTELTVALLRRLQGNRFAPQLTIGRCQASWAVMVQTRHNVYLLKAGFPEQRDAWQEAEVWAKATGLVVV